ncbi:hypothetical protein [Cecembia sp.]|uniref:hypothetical protein n=1 Tax=Cecembia sp. TaxID=1898110 RepID=UPI0025C004E7|nr:hypothetical protein [Cecembia sp.]
MMKRRFFHLSIFIVGIFFSCEEKQQPRLGSGLDFSSSTIVEDGQGSQYTIGFDQVSNINQDPFIHKKNAAGETVWRIRYEETPVDGRGILLGWFEGRLFAVFSVDGGSTASTYINAHQVRAGSFTNVFQSGYERGGGPKVSVVCEIDPNNGQIIRGTFLTARLNNGNTNTLNVRKISYRNGILYLKANSAAWPPGTGTRYVRMPDIDDSDRIDNAFWLYYEMKDDFSEIIKAELLRERF